MTRKNNMFPALAVAAAVTALLVAACATPAGDSGSTARTKAPPVSPVPGVSPELATAAQRTRVPNPDDSARTYKGTGVVVRGQVPGAPGGLPPTQAAAGGNVVLNFEGADLREVVKNILGDILNESYTIDASVGGQVTIRTTSGISRSALPATLETLLRMNGATMVKEDGLYKILPSAIAARGNVTPQLGNSQRPLPSGFSVQVVPLRYIGTREMMRILEPLAKDGTAVRPDDLRNLLILTGTERELKHLLETIDLFDVDWIAGMSVGLFTLQNSDVKAVGQELDKIVGDRNTSPLTGILRIVPIERMNAILVITPQPAYLEEAKKWIARLDQGGGDGPRFYVYSLQNQRAEKLGPLLTQAFTGRAAPATTPAPPTLAPGTPPGQIVSPPSFQQTPSSTTPPPAPPAVQVNVPPPGTAAAALARAAEGIGIVRNIQVVADKDNNTLLIVATPPEYQIIDAALKKLDVPARQVAMEVTIASVTLTDELNFGVEWLFKGGAPDGRGAGGLIVRSTPFNPGAPTRPSGTNPALGIAQGFTYIIQNANFPGGIQAILHLLDTYGDTKVVANPHLAALDNQKATIKAGNKIPICQQAFVGSGVNVSTNVVTTTSQYIDTGVLLQVTPHINAGGLVTLDVQVEVSDPGTLSADCSQAPPINTRSVQTIVNVQSGQTMVMGGLIGETSGNTSKGLPLISRIPIIGGLFGEQTLTKNRTELVMFITPRVVENEIDLKTTIEDLRRRMQQIDDSFDVFRRVKSPDVYTDAPVAPLVVPAPDAGGVPPPPKP
jgi:general secretion pathway protein D